MPSASPASAGIAFLTTADDATSACVLMAPMTTAAPSCLMPFNSAMPPISITVPGLASLSFIAPTRLWPPASALPPVLASAAAASAPDLARWYSNAYMVNSSRGFDYCLALWSACHTRCGVAGMSRYFTPDVDSASCTAFMSAAGAPTAPASPQPLAPSGLWVHGVTLVATLNDGRSSERGMV